MLAISMHRMSSADAECVFDYDPIPVVLSIYGPVDKATEMTSETLKLFLRTEAQAQEIINAGQEALRLLSGN